MPELPSNKFGNLADLGNEASVEAFFVNRLLPDLGYKDSEIRTKASLPELALGRGRQKYKWRPDYALEAKGRVRCIVEAKGIEEDLDDWVHQGSSYCHELNKSEADNPVEFFILTNGISTRVYRWDNDTPVAKAKFGDFVDGNERYDAIRFLLAPTAFATPKAEAEPEGEHLLRRHSVAELNADFAWAHKTIYKRESLSYTAAFMEFVKVIFLKLVSDREARNSPNLRQVDVETVAVPADDVFFSRHWIDRYSTQTPNPLDRLKFQELLEDFETQIASGSKKRIFSKNERLELAPETLKSIAERLENVDLITIDADLNGRMFETFLNSTLRGKALGQYFTPRSVVKLATGLADLKANGDHLDRVIDGCCGTGGFLIEALADMWTKINENSSLSDREKRDLRDQVATKALIGVDIARDPALARIARINMYLHGDGGTSIYQLDALDKKVSIFPSDSPELKREKQEFKARIDGGLLDGTRLADVALTNPPFAKEYSRKQVNDAKLLDDYDLAFTGGDESRRPVQSLSSMVMFLERYHDLLAPHGRLITVLDDGILGASKHKGLRNWIRKNWIIRAVVSLPGDAFQRSQARVKTSVLILEKRDGTEEVQPDVFMYYCSHVGVDDAPRQRVLPGDEAKRQRAAEEIRTVVDLYRKFRNGEGDPAWVVPASAIAERMDVKACLPESGSRISDWTDAGLEVSAAGDLLTRAIETTDAVELAERIVDMDTDADEIVTYLRVKYDGFCEAGEDVTVGDLTKQQLVRVKAGDIVISHINAIHGAIAIVPDSLAGCVVTSEFTVVRPSGSLPASVIWSILRTPESRADMLLLSTGIGRTRVTWDIVRQLQVPIPSSDVRARIDNALQAALDAEASVAALRTTARAVTEAELLLDSEHARTIISAFKPPR
ncbi:N-6 DNA methylase [Aeromicrobium yanjiei]|uniref:N-6 DNA methylase n=1 Tax=Aeromicrobium yanjiei TaxID=2662028 RepID=A0A5Q2M9W8_9ACTN|nr:N-6 DNA methylase [Aeromicrobium yanjiei]QGG39904.1 N-6 DNA methylase [Aeromicrobium yanjiei]